MEITEEDIFKYILFPDEVEPEKKEYIRANENLFSEQINLCKSYLEFSNDNDIYIQSKKAADRILSKFIVVELFPVINKKLQKNNTLTLAAANADIANKQSESITYSDENSKYLVRLINNKEKNTLYFFSNKENKEQKLKITLVPSNEIIHITNNSQQIEIDQHKYIQKILIEQE
ncbi:MAG: hypothetical protein M1480_19130 [Bacteroidetes bacterium]|nr:hypothetical protein [Bacteroidota bacterium]